MPASINNPIVIAVAVESDATGGLDFVVPRAGTVIDVFVVASATNNGGTALVSKADAPITATLVMAVDNVLTRAAALIRANANFAAGETLRVVTNGAADRGIVYVTLLPAGQALAAA